MDLLRWIFANPEPATPAQYRTLGVLLTIGAGVVLAVYLFA